MRKTVFILMLFLVLFTSACGAKARTPITAEEFVRKMETAGFTLVDATDQFEEGQVESVHIAVGENYQVEFYIVPSVEQAKRAFAENKGDMEAAKGSASSNKTVQLANYSSFSQTSDGIYSLVSRTDNTFIYVNTESEYKKEISDIIKDLGY